VNDVGTAARPLRVAIVGAGPAGFYTAEHLQKCEGIVVAIDMFDRLATPYGLVRLGVAPDHEKIKSVTKIYERIATHPGFRFFGCVEVGRDLTDADLADHYDAIVLTVGAPVDRRMGIPGEDLVGSISATDFVAWYNAHPDHRDLVVDLGVEDVVVVGNGNVAVDVARVLATDVEELARTDIADHALELLRTSAVRTVTMLGRRGPAQAAFTPKEIRELGELAGVTLVVDRADLDAVGEVRGDEHAERVMKALHGVAGRTPTPGGRVIRLRFLTSPTELRGTDVVSEVALVENDLIEQDGSLRARATDRTDVIPAGLVLRAVGYRGAAVPGYPFDDRTGRIPNADGRIVGTDGAPLTGRYVAGWIKRGPQGVIGTNKADAGDTVGGILDDLANGQLLRPTHPTQKDAAALVAARAPGAVSWADWQQIDQRERERGAPAGRPRCKFTSLEEMLAVLGR
jgi:ferredoxin/flavodoxin---NADP+ reductase